MRRKCSLRRGALFSREVVPLETKPVQLSPPRDTNLILGQSHFIKTVGGLHEAIVNTVPDAKFGLASCESSGPCLIRSSGNDEQLKQFAQELALRIGAGHSFVILLKSAYPINVLPCIRNVPEVVNIYVATANPATTTWRETEGGRGILGVIDGFSPKGIETEKEIEERNQSLGE